MLAHNIETVPRIFRQIRPGFRYERSLAVLEAAKAAGLITKSNLILGMGEERDEVTAAMKDLSRRRLRPADHHPVPAPVAAASPGRAAGCTPQEFDELGDEARELGFAGVMSGPLVRSSYRAGRLYRPR